MIKKNKPWKWDNNKVKLFKEIKKKFTKGLILRIYQLGLLIRVKADALDFILGVCLL